MRCHSARRWTKRNMLKPQHIDWSATGWHGGCSEGRSASCTTRRSTASSSGRIGCVIPTPLDRAPAPIELSRRSFVTSRVTPTFGALAGADRARSTCRSRRPIPTTDDTLVRAPVRARTATGASHLRRRAARRSMIPVPPDSGRSEPAHRQRVDATLCLNAHRRHHVRSLYAVVADRSFTGNTPHADGGLTDSNHWEVTCTSM